MATASTSPLRVLRSADSHLRCLPVGSNHSMERRPTHLASESSRGAVLRTFALCDDMLEEEKVWISRKVEAVEKVRVVVRREADGARRSGEVASDGTLASNRRADIC